MKTDETGTHKTGILQRACLALVWLQTMVWSFILVGAAGLSVYCLFENPQPWASIGRIWLTAGLLTVSLWLLCLVWAGIASMAARSGRVTVSPSVGAR